MEKKKFDIAILIKNFTSTGGAERYAAEIAGRMVERGHQVDLYARNADSNLTRGMGLFSVPDKLSFSSVLSLWSFAREAGKMLARKKYDIIHAHDKGIACDISTVHTFAYKKGVASHSFFKRLTGIHLSPGGLLHLTLERRQMKSRALVTTSEIIRGDVKKWHGRVENVTVITPGVAIDGFSPEKTAAMRGAARMEENISPGETVLLFVGSEFRRKGLDNLIPALPPETRLVVAGTGERLEHYENLVKEHGLEGRVLFKGLVGNVEKYYALADAVVLPSVKEAFGMVVLEAMACGLPVVTSSAAGSSGLIKSGENGFVFQNPKELPGVLKRLADTKVREAVGAAARKTAEKHTWDNAADEYEKLMESLCRRR